MGKRLVICAMLVVALLVGVSVFYAQRSQEKHNVHDDIYTLSELRFQDNITTKALDYAQAVHPGWQWSVVTLCTWPNETVTVLVYGNYTINCKGYICSRTRGVLYAVNLNLTNLGLISLRKVHSNTYDELINRCEEVWSKVEKKGLNYCRSNLTGKCQVLTYCLWPNRTMTFLFLVNYTTVCRGYNCENENGTFYEVTFEPSWKVISLRRVSDKYFELTRLCDLAWLSKWGNRTEG
ncbi:hypothetical protein [Thermococcus sp.]|uniref:hypothetical protein n=1 Tax=Thermococcus sp. TaxID=35749 RepID=UPI00262ACED5|nr:hypothetical protein [Thermococcus sp.]